MEQWICFNQGNKTGQIQWKGPYRLSFMLMSFVSVKKHILRIQLFINPGNGHVRKVRSGCFSVNTFIINSNIYAVPVTEFLQALRITCSSDTISGSHNNDGFRRSLKGFILYLGIVACLIRHSHTEKQQYYFGCFEADSPIYNYMERIIVSTRTYAPETM
jgi:hypothetical protein